MDEPTAWEDINPPMASALRRGLPSQSSGPLEPASTEDFRNELTACLTLVAPVGMTEEAKRDWLAVAWMTLKHLPSDVLAKGAKAARETCDHPAKIVPAIIAGTKGDMERRWNESRDERDFSAPRLPPPDFVTPTEAASILREYGLKGGDSRLRGPGEG